MIKKLDLEKIESVLDSYTKLKTELDAVQSKVKLSEPQPPEIVETAQQWDDYVKALNKWQDQKNVTFNSLQSKVKTEKQLHKQLIELVPPNTWIKVSGDRYIGYNTDSWPGYQPTLLIVGKEEKKPVLKHVNS